MARSRHGDEAELVTEAAIALGSMRASGPDLVIACRRMVERHPELGSMWWLCSRLLTASDPTRMAWHLADELREERTARAVATALPDDATVLTIGWPAVAGEALVRRGDARVLCADSRHEASAFMRLLERSGVESDPVPAESLARAIAMCDLVLLEPVAGSPDRVLAPIGSHVVAAVAADVGVPVWCVLGLGHRLPVEYVHAIADRVVVAPPDFDTDVDELAVRGITHVATADGVTTDVRAALQPECSFAPDLLRASPI